MTVGAAAAYSEGMHRMPTLEPPMPPATRRLLSLALSVAAGLLAAALLLAALARPALAAPAAQTYDFPGACGATLQSCLNAASPGDTIRVLPGIYTASLTLNKAVSLTGVSSATTILRADVFQRVLTVTGAAVNPSVVISGLTFSGGQLLSGCPAACRGAGVLVTGTAQPLFVNVTISGNVSFGLGGGLHAYIGSPLVMAHSLVRGNLASLDGGGAFVWGAASLTGVRFEANQCTQTGCDGGGVRAFTLALTDTQFINNAASRGGGAYSESNATLTGGLFQSNQSNTSAGGGLLTPSALTLTGTQFISNLAGTSGGGAFADSASLTGGLFQGNTAGEDGGGLYTRWETMLIGTTFLSNSAGSDGGGASAWLASLTGVVFQGNTAERGGGVALPIGSQVVNNLFANNQATANEGAAIFIGSGTISLLHNTIANVQPDSGSAIYVDKGNVTALNNLITLAAVGLENGDGTLVENANLFDSVTLPYVGDVTSGGSSLLNGQAAFVNAPGGDFRLTENSDAIDAGFNAGVSVDAFGGPRPLGAGFDIGFHEFGQGWRLYLPLVTR